jgi:hypothetical protein
VRLDGELISPLEHPIASINALNDDNTLDANSAQLYLTDILNEINTVKSQVVGFSAKRDLIFGRQSGDLNEVGAVLAQVIKDLVEAVEGIADDLEKLPLIVSCHLETR